MTLTKVSIDGDTILKVLSYSLKHPQETVIGSTLGHFASQEEIVITEWWPKFKESPSSYDSSMLQYMTAATSDPDIMGSVIVSTEAGFISNLENNLKSHFNTYQRENKDALIVLFDPQGLAAGVLELKAYRLNTKGMTHFSESSDTKNTLNTYKLMDLVEMFSVSVSSSPIITMALGSLPLSEPMYPTMEMVDLSKQRTEAARKGRGRSVESAHTAAAQLKDLATVVSKMETKKE
eukprot:gnl/Dysnectes_brevis/1104_a1235_4552.p1 GENE.gnl/Dysnectes_brevis/1104_a1235_4552~~gnl/Dysnectes_brevis/1104_a1235_4552.p1  ORF type:complete len:235 (+),score=64.56 gnl/Dysnectes_brevis/1104_a1235_4552:127-831(+)